MNNNKKKIYITGVSGFIGSRIARFILSKDYQVIGITRKLSSVVKNELGIDVIEADLNDTSQLELDTAHTLIHCATANDILSKDISAGFSLSVIGTVKILEASKRAGIQNVIFFSTAQVYGTELNGYFDEFSKINCETPYALNHYFGEEMCKFYSDNYNFNTAVLRPSNVYGVPEISTVNRNTLVPMCFVEEAIKHGSITLRSSGKQTRNFISTDEVADIVIKNLKNFPKGFTKINCSSNLNLSILDIAKVVVNSYEKNFKRKLIINVKNDEPKQSNIFEYKSKYFTNPIKKDHCLKNMESVVDQLFKKFKKI